MKILHCLFFVCFLYFPYFSFSFIFFPNQKITQNDFFWHLKILNVEKIAFQFENLGKGVRVGILDTYFENCKKTNSFSFCKAFSLSNNFKTRINFPSDESERLFDESSCAHKYFSENDKFVGQLSTFFLKKFHGACVANLIQQIAPNVEIISIPIFNTQARTSTAKFIQALCNALEKKIDILCIALKIEDNISEKEKIKILNLLSQFRYVVAPSGNDGGKCFKTAFPANSIFFSVGAFEQQKDQYFICDFSQYEKDVSPHFMMPGKDLGCFVWDGQKEQFVSCLVSGTSMASACMVGILAILLSEGGTVFSPEQIAYVIQKNSFNLTKSLRQINLLQCLFCIQELQKVKETMSAKKFAKRFAKEVDKILKS